MAKGAKKPKKLEAGQVWIGESGNRLFIDKVLDNGIKVTVERTKGKETIKNERTVSQGFLEIFLKPYRLES